MVVHCFQIYKEVLYRFIRSRSLLRCCNGCLARGGAFLPKMGIIYVDVNCGTQDERMVCFEHWTLFSDIQRGVLLIIIARTYVVWKLGRQWIGW
jgi:hypothetical protein